MFDKINLFYDFYFLISKTEVVFIIGYNENKDESILNIFNPWQVEEFSFNKIYYSIKNSIRFSIWNYIDLLYKKTYYRIEKSHYYGGDSMPPSYNPDKEFGKKIISYYFKKK